MLLVNKLFLSSAKAVVSISPDESLCSLVAEKLKMGCLWKKLSSKLKVRWAIMESIQEEERGDGEECCRNALKKWRESNGSKATVRELMSCLTDMGYGNINWYIMKKLKLVAREDIPQSVILLHPDL